LTYFIFSHVILHSSIDANHKIARRLQLKNQKAIFPPGLLHRIFVSIGIQYRGGTLSFWKDGFELQVSIPEERSTKEYLLQVVIRCYEDEKYFNIFINTRNTSKGGSVIVFNALQSIKGIIDKFCMDSTSTNKVNIELEEYGLHPEHNDYDPISVERIKKEYSLPDRSIHVNNNPYYFGVENFTQQQISIDEQFSALLHRLSNLETDVTDINRKLQSITSVLEVLVGNKGDCPRLIIILPKDGNKYLQMLINPVNVALYKSFMIVRFVCPITYKSIDDYEIEIKDVREFVKKYGPILLISIRILQVGMTVGKLLGLPLPSADLFPISELKSIVALNNSNNAHDKLMTLALNKMSEIINEPIDQNLTTFSTQLDTCLSPEADSFNNKKIHQSLQSITDANYKEFFKLLSNNYTIDIANELRGKMTRLCGGDGCVEWVSVAGEDEWYTKHGRLDGSNFTLNNIHKINSDNNIEPINTRQCCILS